MIEEQEPMPMEGWVHISVAIEAGTQQGQATERTLAQMGVNGADWQRVHTFWQTKMSASQPELIQAHERYLAHYRPKYGLYPGGLNQEQFEQQAVQKVLEMGRAGQAAQVQAFLQEAFPGDADDLYALRRWVKQACEKCGESGDRATAQQLLPVAHAMDEDEDDPLDEWVASEMESLFD